MKRVLITGAGSYIGTSFERWMEERYPGRFQIDTVDMAGDSWRNGSFAGYDAVFHVAGIAHRKETKQNASEYYRINRDLTITIAKEVKKSEVKQFVLLSSMSVYGKTTGLIKKGDAPNPKSHYGRSKYEADMAVTAMSDETFKVAILRPPMVYGKNCKGNYQKLKKFALKSPVFPDYDNERSMIFIDNLCEFVKTVIEQEDSGLFLPQNEEYICTGEMVRLIAEAHGRKLHQTRLFNLFIPILPLKILQKVFGSLKYEKTDVAGSVKLEESIRMCEK